MKTTLTNLKLTLSLFLLFICFIGAQAQRKNTTIRIVVNTAQINQNNKDQMVKFYDDNGASSTNGNHANFVSLIDTEKFVFWYGEVEDVPNNAGDVVNVIQMEMKERTGNKQLLKSKKYRGTTFVRGKVKNNYEEGEEAYNITFTVTRNGGQPVYYTIDPKLRINN